MPTAASGSRGSSSRAASALPARDRYPDLVLGTHDRVQLRLADCALSARHAAVLEHLRAFELVGLQAAVLGRAADPFPTSLGTLDAIHLRSIVRRLSSRTSSLETQRSLLVHSRSRPRSPSTTRNSTDVST
jgi:hypothetical protein